MKPFHELSDAELLALLERFARTERAHLCEFLACLSVVDQKLSATKSGYGSLFEYCTSKLRYSEDEAYKRIQVARATISHPDLLTYINEGSLTLIGAAKLAPRLKEISRRDASRLIEAALKKSTREIEELIAPVIRGTARPTIRPIKRVIEPPETHGPLFEVSQPAARPPEPETIDLYRVSFDATPDFKAELDRAAQLLSHKYPFGQPDGILRETLREWLARHDPLRRPQPRSPVASPASERVSAWARDAVWKRDGGRCAYVAGGRRCESRKFLEVDHVVPKALGGTSTPENLRLLCRAHNDLERRRILGEGEVSEPAQQAPGSAI